VLAKILPVEKTIKFAVLTMLCSVMLLIPISMLSTALAQSVVTEVSEPGVKPNEYYMFTQELNANESKLGVPVVIFTLTNIIVHKGDNVTIHFYNTWEDVDDRHSFTMQSPYKMNHDLAGGENRTFSFKTDTVEVLPITVYTIYPV
jgi:hypothetical protein